MKRLYVFVVCAVAMVLLLPTAALAGTRTYPPPTPPPQHPVPPSPAAFTGADISTPVKIMFGLVVVGVLFLVASLLFIPKDDRA